MNAIAQKFGYAFRGFMRLETVLSAPEPAYGKPRQMTGFLSTLTEEQREKALSYHGDDTHGDESFARKKKA